MSVNAPSDGVGRRERTRPRLGLLGVMQALYDDMLPGITERQAAFAHRVAARLEPVADVFVAGPAKGRAEVEGAVGDLRDGGVDGLVVVMLTYGPSLHAAPALRDAQLPILLANIQPEPSVGRDWTMAEMTFNQGVHGAQDLANALVRLEVPFDVISEAWQEERFLMRVGEWARAAAAAREWRRLRVAVFGHAMRGTGDVRFDEAALRRLGPEVEPFSTGDLVRARDAVDPAAVDALLREEERRYAVDPGFEAGAREESARMQLALTALLGRGGFGAFSIHFGALASDGRFGRLPLAAASALMARGYGYGAEGDALTAALVATGDPLAGPAHFTEMYAMDFERDAILLSHMGEGNPEVARDDEAVRLADRELGIGGLGRPPTLVFRLRPGPVTLSALAPLAGGAFRLVLAQGKIVDDAPIPALEMPYGTFHPEGGVRACMEGWLTQGGPHHVCLVPGHHAERWRTFANLVGAEAVRV